VGSGTGKRGDEVIYRRIFFGFLGCVLVLFAGWWLHGQEESSADRLLLLVPDGADFSDPRVTVWLDAASEEGLHVVPVHDSAFVRPLFSETRCAGVILPDSIHQRAGDAFLMSLRRYVSDGGKLMLVYDAATLSLEGRYAASRARFSDVAGIDYALYDSLREKSIEWSAVSAAQSTFRELGVPPGKYFPFHTAGDGASLTPDEYAPAPGDEAQLRRYQFGDLQYPSFVTSGNYAGRVFLHSHAGIVAGQHDYEKGSVLFVNLPLGNLKRNTDGLLLHAFLKHFAEQAVGLPSLLAVPDGIGGVVLNWHVDSNAAIKPLQEIASWQLVKQGPYSIHITAGPDAEVFGDRKGFDVDRNPVSRDFIEEYVKRGYQIGSHGGWIHDYFSAHVDKDNPKDLEQFLAWNQSSLERASGRPVVEYSAPSGNQPAWVTNWLEAHGFVAYYFAGDTGMGPTQGYRDGVREGRDIWAFPVVHLDRAAAFEEMSAQGYSAADVEDWLEAVTDFAASQRCVRLIYFHPPGILEYHDVIDQWMQLTARLSSEGRFRWYTMSQLAAFLNSRKHVQWRVSKQEGITTIRASHPESLEHFAWRLQASGFSRPIVQQGSAQITHEGADWIVVAGAGKELQFQMKAGER
jgi:Polysaccharide deacetylase